MDATAIEAAIDGAPDKPEHYLALADALGEDPRAELIRLQCERQQAQSGKTPREQELVAQLAPPDGDASLEWFCGFIAVADLTVSADAERDVRRFLAHPSARHTRALTVDIGYDAHGGGEDRWVVPLVVAAPCRAALRRLVLHQSSHAGETPAMEIDLAGLWDVTRLERLDAMAGVLKLNGGAPTLREAVLDGAPMKDVLELVSLAPELRKLNVRGDDLYGSLVDKMLAAAERLEKLDELQVPFVEPAQQKRLVERLPRIKFHRHRG